MSGYVFAAFYDIVRRIPAGTAATYGQVARLAGMPPVRPDRGLRHGKLHGPHGPLSPGGRPLRRHKGLF